MQLHLLACYTIIDRSTCIRLLQHTKTLLPPPQLLTCLNHQISQHPEKRAFLRWQLYRVLDQQCVVPLIWIGRVIAWSSRRLVPGDVVVLQRGKATCDMVLLRGAGLVEESMLSGEVNVLLPTCCGECSAVSVQQ